MSLEALHLGNTSTSPTPPSGPTGATKVELTEPGTREWVRLTDIYLACLRGTPNSAPWIPVSLVVLSMPDLTATPPRSTWYLMFVPRDPSVHQTHTIDLTARTWNVCIEEGSFMFSFELKDVGEGGSLRYFVKTGSKMAFDYILSYTAYIKGCRVGAITEGY